MRLEIERVSEDKLSRDLWVFASHMEHHGQLQITLDLWEPQARPTTRHKWAKSGPGYKRRPHNGVIHFGGYLTPAAEVPLPDDVAAEAKDAVVNSIEVRGAADPVVTRRA